MSRYTASDAFFEALWDAGITHCFVNLGSDHPSIIEATTKGQSTHPNTFPRIITCPNEMVALSMADGYARLTSRPQCVIVHVDVGTQGLGAAVHNASCGRAPVLIFAGLSPFTDRGEKRGSRTEYIHWIQDVPDQKAIVAQYCRYTAEVKCGKNIKEMVNRALMFATSAPTGPVYLCAAREVLEEELHEPYLFKQERWRGVKPAALTEESVQEIAEALVGAQEPLLVTGYSGRNHSAPGELVKLADAIPGLRVLDTGGSDMCFPATHRASLGLRYGVDPAIGTADVILVLDCDVPWIPTQCHPKHNAKVYHIDVDPLKMQMPVGWIEADGTYRADSYTALKQLNKYISSTYSVAAHLDPNAYTTRRDRLQASYDKRQALIRELALPKDDGTFNASSLTTLLRTSVPANTIFAVEAVTNAAFVADALSPTLPGTWINCGGGGLGWSGGAALGIKLAAGAGRFVCQIVADGTFLFSVPGSVYWISRRYNLPVLTIVLNNGGWHAPRRSLLLVHPDGWGSKVSNEELNIGFTPSPDYAGIATAASAGHVWGAKASRRDELERLLPVAVQIVKEGRGAVLDCVLDAKVEGTSIAAEKGDSVVEEGAEERGAGKAVLVG